jgi:manganese efflux pump family protein
MTTGALTAGPATPLSLPLPYERPLSIAALFVWLLTISIGAYMLRTWIARGGLRRQRATGVGAPPPLVFGHPGAALTGLAIWVSYLASGLAALAWAGVALIAIAITLGISMVTLWTPYPVRPAPEGAVRAAVSPRPDAAHATGEAFTVTDEMIAGLLARPYPARRPRRLQLLPLIPVVHGFSALATFLLALYAAVSARLGTPRLGGWAACRAGWNHGREADDDGGPRAPRRRGVEHRRRAGRLLRSGDPDGGRDLHER